MNGPERGFDADSAAAVADFAFPDSSDFAYPDSSDVCDDANADETAPNTSRDTLVTPEPIVRDETETRAAKRTMEEEDDASDRVESTSTSVDNSFSINIVGDQSLLGQISTDDSGFCLSAKGDEDDDEEEKRKDVKVAENERDLAPDNPENGESLVTNGDTREPFVDAAIVCEVGSSVDPSTIVEGGEERNDPIDQSFDAMEIPDDAGETNNRLDYVDSDIITDNTGVDEGVIAAASNDAKSPSAGDDAISVPVPLESPEIEPSKWREFPLVFFNKEAEAKLQPQSFVAASIGGEEEKVDEKEAETIEHARSRHSSYTVTTPDPPDLEDDFPKRPSTPTWSTDGSNVLDSFDSLISLLPCDLRGWAIHKSECGECLALVHTKINFKTLEPMSDVVVVFEREWQKLKKSSYNLPKDPPLDRSTRHLLDDARGSRGRLSSRAEESYPDSRTVDSPRWNYVVKHVLSGETHKISGPRTLTPGSLAAILRFALRPPPGLKRKYSEPEVDEIIEQELKRPRQPSPMQNGPAQNSKQSSASMLECFKCKKLVSMAVWSTHPCFQQAVGPPSATRDVGSKRGMAKNELFCKYCKLRFKDAFMLKGHEVKFPGGSCNMVINCSVCKRKFTSRGSYAIHLQGAEGKRCKKGHFRCRVCKSFWADDLELIDHFRKTHPCPRCKFLPNSFEDYDVHSRSCIRHSNSVPFASPAFASKKTASSTTQSCRHCLLIFASSTELAVHLRTSRACGEAVKPVQSSPPGQLLNPPTLISCQQCRKSFGTNYELADHMKKFHMQQTYLHRCVFCPKNFATAEMLKAHCSKVHGNANNSSNASSYDCKVCSLKFISFSGLSRHLKMKHGIRGGGNENNNGAGGAAGGGGGGGVKNSQSRASSAEIDVSSTSTPVTLKFKNYPDSATAVSDAAPQGNKSLSEEDFLQDVTDPSPASVAVESDPAAADAVGGSGGDSFKCSNCFLFFDDSAEFTQHRANCG